MLDVGKPRHKEHGIVNPEIFRNMKRDYEMYASQLQTINFKRIYSLIAPASFLAVVEEKGKGLEGQESYGYQQSNDKRGLSVEQKCSMNKQLRQVLNSYILLKLKERKKKHI